MKLFLNQSLAASRPFGVGLLFCAITILPISSSLAERLDGPTAAAELGKIDFFDHGQGMHLSPGILSQLENFRGLLSGTRADETVMKTLLTRWGIQSANEELIGIKNVRYQGMKVGVVGCVACHSGKAAGQYIVGIGNKNIDPGQMGKDGVLIESAFKLMTDQEAFWGIKNKSTEYRAVENSSLDLMRLLKDPRLSAQTQGLVPISLVGSWFFKMAGQALPMNGFKGAVKVPSWFGFGKKLEVGQFADAIGQGHPPGWIIGVEITAGQTAENVRNYFAKVEHASNLIAALTPPPYPFKIDEGRAARGKMTFEQTCIHCHGSYAFEPSGLPIYQAPKMVALDAVGTDSDRLDYVTEDFLALVRASPLANFIKASPYAGKRMYVAPRLNAIWARFPYLHNASVPTLRDLLEPAAKRPKWFSLKDAGELRRFDFERVGIKAPTEARDMAIQQRDTRKKKRWIYDTAAFGQSNQGHEKYTDLSDLQKDELVEYLKTL